MKLDASISAILCLCCVSAGAGSIGFWGGQADTETFGKGVAAGAQVEMDAVPWLSVLVRGGYEGEFDDVSISEAGFVPGNHARRVLERIGLDPSRTMLEDFAVVPVEAGLVLRLPALFDVIGIYGAAGAGWYVMPGFDMSCGGRSVSTDVVTDLVGWWAAAGVDIGFTPVHLFAEAKWTAAKKDGETFDLDWHGGDSGSVRGDVDLTGLTVLGGIRIEW